ncbi:hypothetical protein P8452_62937 [Trifolium repens]|nr:hypothetical protein P8452_62937 [Trifolium repens]
MVILSLPLTHLAQRKVNDVESQRKRKSSRCNCSAKMLVINRTIGFKEKWVVNYFNNHHNHELLDDKEVQFLPAYRKISIVDQNRIHLLSKIGCPVSLIMRVLELEKGINTGNLPLLKKDIRNFIQSHSGIGHASNVLKLCKSLKDFVNQVGVAVKIRNQVGEEARMRQKYHNPIFRTSFPIEEHVASILTPYAFG